MKQICAWCGMEISGPAEADTVSYGICLPCVNEVIVNIPCNLRDFVEQITVPVVLLDCLGVVKVANSRAKAMLHREVTDIEEHLAGEVFECAYSQLPGGCGMTLHCAGCVIRNSVMRTYQTGTPITRMPATLKQHDPERPEEVRFFISTDKIGELVMLKVYGEH